MLRKPLLSLPVLAAAVAASGCIPAVQHDTASQVDLIAPAVTAGADVCETPLPSSLLGAVAVGNLRSAARSVTRLAEEPAATATCPDPEDVVDAANQWPFPRHQALVAFRVPAGTTAPDSFTATAEVLPGPDFDVLYAKGGGPSKTPATVTETITFRRSAELDTKTGAALDAIYAGREGAPAFAGPGQKVVGYVSDPIGGTTVGSYSVRTTFGLPSGTAAGSTVNTLTAVGTRAVMTDGEWAVFRDGLLGTIVGGGGIDMTRRGVDDPRFDNPMGADRPIECFSPADVTAMRGVRGTLVPAPVAALLLGVASTALCPQPASVTATGSSTPEAQLAALKTALAGVDTKVRDLQIAGSDGFAEQGGTASVPFTFRTGGDASDRTLAVTASTALPGASATPNAATSTFPAAGDTAKPVTVTVPANAVPGTYAVTLTAKVGGQTRTGTGHVVVLPRQSAQAPAATATTTATAPSRGRDNLYMGADGSIAFGWICPPACGGNTVDVTAPKAGIAPKANTAAVAKPRLLRIARGTFTAKTGKRARVKVKLFPRAQSAVRAGRSVTALVIVRDASGKPQVRRVVIRRRK